MRTALIEFVLIPYLPNNTLRKRQGDIYEYSSIARSSHR